MRERPAEGEELSRRDWLRPLRRHHETGAAAAQRWRRVPGALLILAGMLAAPAGWSQDHVTTVCIPEEVSATTLIPAGCHTPFTVTWLPLIGAGLIALAGVVLIVFARTRQRLWPYVAALIVVSVATYIAFQWYAWNDLPYLLDGTPPPGGPMPVH